MKQISCSRFFIIVLFALTFFTYSHYAIAGEGPKGKEKTVADNTFGAGGFKTTFTINNVELSLFRDANKNRRLFETTYTYGNGEAAKTSASVYYDCLGKKDYLNVETFNRSNTLIQSLQADFSGGKLTDASTWQLLNGARREYNFIALNNRFEVGTLRKIEVYKPVYSVCPRIDLRSGPEFSYTLVGMQHYTATEISNTYTGGKETIEAYKDYDEFDGEYKVVEKKAYDKNGVLRHQLYTEYYIDGCAYEEEFYYDCYGNLIYRSYTFYDDEGYDYEFAGEIYKGGKLTAGYYYYDGYDFGEEYTYDPETDFWKRGWHPEVNEPADFEPDTSDCPDALTFWNHDFYFGPALIREDDGGDGFSLYGVEFSYTRNVCTRGGLTGDIRATFGKIFDVNYTKIIALAGGTYFPVKTAVVNSDIRFSVHALAGVTFLTSKYSSGSFSNKNTDTYFTIDAGIGLGYKIADKLGIGLRAAYLPTFGNGNTTNNFGVSLGVELRY